MVRVGGGGHSFLGDLASLLGWKVKLLVHIVRTRIRAKLTFCSGGLSIPTSETTVDNPKGYTTGTNCIDCFGMHYAGDEGTAAAGLVLVVNLVLRQRLCT